MNFTRVLSMIAVFILTFAQEVDGQSWLWAKRAGGSSYDNGKAVATDAMGNVYVAGDFYSRTITVGYLTFTNAGEHDIFLVKYDATGNVIWAKNAEGNSEDVATSITIDNAGNIYVAGTFESMTLTFGDSTIQKTSGGNQSDIFLVKYDPDGNVLWVKSAGGVNTEHCLCVKTDLAGNVFITGNFKSPIMYFGPTIIANSSAMGRDQNIFAAKYDAGGNLLWAKSVGGTGPNFVSFASTDSNGNIYIAGYFVGASFTFGTTVLTKTTSEFEDIFLVKYDANGHELWAKGAGGYRSDFPTSLATDSTGNAYMTGFFRSPTLAFGATTLTNTDITGTQTDFFLVKYDPTGSVVWAKTLQAGSGTVPLSIVADATGDIYVAGFFGSDSISFDSVSIKSAGESGNFIVKYDRDGKVVWTKNLGNTGTGTGVQSITTDRVGNIYITGTYIEPTVTFGATTLLNIGSGTNDLFLAKIAPTLLPDPDVCENKKLNLFPNPASGTVNLTSDSPIPITAIQIFDLLGRNVFETTHIDPQYTPNYHAYFDLPELPDGNYVLSLNGCKNNRHLQFTVKK